METSLPNVNTSDGCFNIGVLLSNRDFTEDAINMRKYEPYLLKSGDEHIIRTHSDCTSQYW